MIDFLKIDSELIFRYTPEIRENWVSKAFEQRSKIIFKKTFTFNQDHLVQLKSAGKFIGDGIDEYDELNHLIFYLRH